ncbi:MAG: DUF4038 domain-containing protein [Armatimonadetes bacterium]|nr:DUF4038 domain-containing protein [Armatimonadota bacterium]
MPSATFSAAADSIPAWEFVELEIRPAEPPAGNPFDVEPKCALAREGGPVHTVRGFCDSADGSLYRLRLLATQPGEWHYHIHFGRERHSGQFTATPSGRRGLLRVDPAHPYHFQWAGTGEHLFWNAATTFALIGWRDEAVIRQAIDRLAGLGVNRLRAALIPPRVHSGQNWYEPAMSNNEQFTTCVNVWPAARPESVEDPGFDVTRFNLEQWRKYERMLTHARERDMLISVIFYVDGRLPGVDPFRAERAGGPDEQRYYRYAAARLAAWSNVMWDVTNEYQLFRDEAWAEQMGAFLRAHDPYGHLISVHGHERFPFRTSPWADFAMYQCWDEHGGHDFMLRNRREQAETGRPMPQVNEEYGYEEHYPVGWGESRTAPARCAENRCALAWEIAMAGGYQTTGERADVPDMGGWITGLGDDSMRLFELHRHLVTFFTSFAWWALDPAPERVTGPALCLARADKLYALYRTGPGEATVELGEGTFKARRFDLQTGEWSELGEVSGPHWAVPESGQVFWLARASGV